MPVTKTAKRALRSSKRKQTVNGLLIGNMEAAIRVAQRTKSGKDIQKAVSLADRAAKKNLIHHNKAGHIKSQLARLSKPKKTAK